jgi:hypothetical protein
MIIRSSRPSAFKTFELYKDKPDMPINGIARLSEFLTINGQTKSPLYRYRGIDANSTDLAPWKYGEILTRQTGGTQPEYRQGSIALGPMDRSVRFSGAGSDFYKAGNATFGQVSTEDIVSGIIFNCTDDSAHRSILATRTGNVGWEWTFTSSHRLRVVLHDSSGYIGIYSDTLITGRYYDAWVFVDRNGYAQIYVNGLPSGSAVDVSSYHSTLNGANEFHFGSRVANQPFDGDILYAATWIGQDWLDTHVQDDLAAKLSAKFWGQWPQLAKGTAAPILKTRNYPAYVDKAEPDGNVVNDGDMERESTSDWTPWNDAILTKESYGVRQVLRVAYDGTMNAYAYQQVLTPNKTYRITGRARGDGSSGYPRILWGGTSIWTGTISNEWQELDEVFVTSAGDIRLYNWGASGYSEFDNIVIKRIYLEDGDMELPGVARWDAQNDAVLTKQSDPVDGSRCLRIAYDGTTNPFARQLHQCEPGERYRITGFGRSDGVTTPRVSNIGSASFNLTTSTDWQYFDVSYTASAVRGPFLYALASTDGYVEFDKITLEKVPPRRYYLAGEEALRCVARPTQKRIIKGGLSEPQSQNLFTYCDDFNNAVWTKTRCTINSDSIDGPGPGIQMDAVVCSVDNDTHSVRTNITLTADDWTFSAVFKAGDKEWIKVVDSITGAYAHFDLANVAIGTNGNGALPYIEDLGDGFVLVVLKITGTAASHYWSVFVAENDNDVTFAGDGVTEDIYIWYAQCENYDYATSPIITGASAETRSKDQLRFKSDDGNLGGVGSGGRNTCGFDFMLPDFTPSVYRQFLVFSDGGSSNDAIWTFMNLSASNRLSTYIRVGGAYSVQLPVDGNICDGNQHRGYIHWKPDDVRLMVDADKAQDTSAVIPDDLDRIDICQFLSGNDQLGGVFANLEIYSEALGAI